MRIAVALSLAALLLTPLTAFAPVRRSDGPADDGPKGEVLFRTDASRETLGRLGLSVVEAYPSFTVVRGSPAAAADLRSKGFRADALADPWTLDLLAGRIDVRDSSRNPGTRWSLNARGDAVGIVHFHAPIKETWTSRLGESGIEVLRYQPTNGLVVRGSLGRLEALRHWSEVDWVGPYEGSWKIRPGTADGDPSLADVRIVLFPRESAAGIASWLSTVGVLPGPRAGSGPAFVGSFGTDDFRWIRARVPSALLPRLVDRPEIEFVERVQPVRLANADTSWVVQTNRLVGGNASRDLRYTWYGLDGRGQIIGISDTGMDYDHNQFRESAGTIATGDLHNTTDVARRKLVRYVNMGVLTDALSWIGGGGPWDPWSIADSDHTPTGLDCTFGHGTSVASVLAGNDDWSVSGGPNDGTARGAKVYLQDIGTVGPDPEGTCFGNTDVLSYLPEDYSELFGPAGLVYNDPVAPVRIHSNSWGTDVNEYDVSARTVDAFVWGHPDLTILFPSGNIGPSARSVGSPATAKNVVTVGGVGNPDSGVPSTDPNDVTVQSSRGPTTDGRLKPTIVAVFDGDSATSDGDPRSGARLADDHWAGTSYSTPAAAAAAAIVRQYFVDGWYPTGAALAGNGRVPSAALVRAVLIASGTQITGDDAFRPGTDTWPNSEQGFGRATLSNVLRIAALGEPARIQVADGTSGLLTGDTTVHRFRVASAAAPLKFVLAWADYPGTIGAGKALVNDLNLEVTDPDGNVYLGNVFGTFVDGQSRTGGFADSTNVEEAVLRKAPVAGVWTVRVIGGNVPVGPQAYAIVAAGDLDPAYGRVRADLPVYAPGDAIGVEVEDSDAGSVVVRVSSTFEPTGEAIVLAGGAGSGVWRGSLPVALGPTGSDGILQVRDGDTITVAYDDGSPVHTDTASARVDAAGPTIHDVVVERPAATSLVLRWQTDEPATSGARYGTSPASLSRIAESADLRTVHELRIPGLSPGTLYYIDVVSRDRRGLETRDAKDGTHYRAMTSPLGDVLLVLGDASFPEDRVALYATDLDARGWTWSPWRVAAEGPPPLSLLQAHPAVIWQVGLEEYPPFNDSARALVKAYLDGGGRLLVSSHDTAWALAGPTSQFETPAGAAWVQGVLKASFDCDPPNVVRLLGRSPDPIAGAYAAGIGYTAHREGGAADWFTTLPAGGTASVVWDADDSTRTCGNQARPVGLRWVSGAANGTAGAGTWGGTRSRLVYFAFELTGADGAFRGDVLDNALRWLLSTATNALDRDHPDVAITAPNDGTFGGPVITINWTASPSGGLVDFVVSVSGDRGATWANLATLSGSARSYAWDASGQANGDGFLVRVSARDTGTPALTARDESDAAFTIVRPGGDIAGPRIWAGSIRATPNPPGAASPVTFNGTADDRGTGGAAVAAAELFLAPAEPLPSAYGSGAAMDPADGSFDGALEALTWAGALAAAPGGACSWVHARDAAGNWGPFQSACFVILSTGPDVTPPAVGRPVSARLVAAGGDIELVWERAWDDLLYGGTAEYRVVRSTTPAGPRTDVSGAISASGALTYSFVDVGAGRPDPSDYFYRIESIDAAANVAATVAFGAKIHLSVDAGSRLLGIPVDPGTQALDAFVAGVGWSAAFAYDACAAGFRWTSAGPGEAGAFALRPGQGFWFNGTSAGSVLVVGLVPATATVGLCAGWNLVALPGFATSVTVGDLRAATGAVAVYGQDMLRPFGTKALSDADVLVPGAGYWFRVPSAVPWTVPGS